MFPFFLWFNKLFSDVRLMIVLYGYKTWSLTLREENILRVFEKRALSEK